MSALHDRAFAREADAVPDKKSLLSDAFLDVIGVQDELALVAAIRSFTSATGFDRYSIGVIHDDFSLEGVCLR